MYRPCFLVVDREYAGSISTRKLVIETGKFNVITAYSGREAIETVRRFPGIDGVVMDAGMTDIPCDELVAQLKAIQPKLPIVAVSSPRGEQCDAADHLLESFDPRVLLELLKTMRPDDTAAIEQRNEDLASGRN